MAAAVTLIDSTALSAAFRRASFCVERKGCTLAQSVLLGKSLSVHQRRSILKERAPKNASLVAAQAFEISGQDSNFMASLNKFFDGFFRKLRGADTEKATEDSTPIVKTVLVAGATGRTGKLIVKKLLEKNICVVALVASEERADEVLVKELGLVLGKNKIGGELVTVVGDLTEQETVNEALKGVDGVICAVGNRYGGNGFLPNGSPEEVYGKGIKNLVNAATAQFEAKKESSLGGDSSVALFDFGSPLVKPAEASENGNASIPGGKRGVPSRVPGWYVLDDVIMGGISDGGLRQEEGKAIFEGTLRAEGGGFSSVRSELDNAPIDLSGMDGIRVKVKGDGQRYKLGLRTQPNFQGPPFVAMFDTVRGKWTDVTIPFDRFQAADQSNLIPNAEPLNSQKIHAVQILASLFQFNKQANPLTSPGPFKLEIASISAYRSPRPFFVLVSSAAVERSARITSEEERDKSIPIVKLNPGGVLTWKLQAEDRLKASGLPYSIVRPCGLTDKDIDSSFLLEVGQGDVITGLISRDETATVVVESLELAEATNTTFEVRRDELSKGLKTVNFQQLFRRLRPDSFTGAVHLISPAASEPRPFPASVPVPPVPQELGVKVTGAEERKEGKPEVVVVTN